MMRNPYGDRKAPDGVVATGWRYVKKGGVVKFGGTYYSDKRLLEIIGEYVHVAMNDYWQQDVIISCGVIGCCKWYCEAVAVDNQLT